MGDKNQIVMTTFVSAAMCLNFLWFDMCGHASSLIGFDLWLRKGGLDGHTLFLLGMCTVSLVMAGLPKLFFQIERPGSLICVVPATAAAATMVFPSSISLSAIGALLTGFTNVFMLAVSLSLLSRVVDHARGLMAVVVIFTSRLLFMYVCGTLLPEEWQRIVLLLLPALCAICIELAERKVDRRAESKSDSQFKFEVPLSTAMLGILVAASVIFAIACAVSSVGFWGISYPFSGLSPAMVLFGAVGFAIVCHVTLVQTQANFLYRILPGAFVLFLAHSFLYLGLGETVGANPRFMQVFSQFVELYGEAFVWVVTLLAIKTLRMDAYRTIGISFVVNSVVTIILQYTLLAGGSGSIIVLIGFYGLFAGLVWTLCHFQGMGKNRSQQYSKRAMQGTPGDRPTIIDEDEKTNETDGDPKLALASKNGLSERETDVFMLLAQGRSRRFICNELLIADGTASSHIGHIYEKMDVHSKQELISLVNRECGSSSETE